MADCYRIPYSDRFGDHVATKWAEKPADAIALVRKAREGNGLGAIECGIPEAVVPAPFSDAARAARLERPV